MDPLRLGIVFCPPVILILWSMNIIIAMFLVERQTSCTSLRQFLAWESSSPSQRT